MCVYMLCFLVCFPSIVQNSINQFQAVQQIQIPFIHQQIRVLTTHPWEQEMSGSWMEGKITLSEEGKCAEGAKEGLKNTSGLLGQTGRRLSELKETESRYPSHASTCFFSMSLLVYTLIQNMSNKHSSNAGRPPGQNVKTEKRKRKGNSNQA